VDKLCRICGLLKSVDNFSIDNMMKNGYRNECNHDERMYRIDAINDADSTPIDEIKDVF